MLDGETREIANELCAKSAALTARASTPATLRAVAIAVKKEHAVARYSTAAHLRKLLMHDPELGGTPIRMVRARWLLEHFQAVGNEAERLEHRQALERAHGDAPFVSGAMLERVLAELESGAFQGVKIASFDNYDKSNKQPIMMDMSLMAMSHMCARARARDLAQLHIRHGVHPCACMPTHPRNPCPQVAALRTPRSGGQKLTAALAPNARVALL